MPRVSLLRYLGQHRGPTAASLGWGLAAGVPAAASGRLVAAAIDAVGRGQGWLATGAVAALVAAGVVAVVATMRFARAAAGLVAGVRGALGRDVVAGNLAAAVADDHPGRDGAEFTVDLEEALDGFRQMVMALPMASGVAGAAVGLATLHWSLAAAVVPFLLAGAAVAAVSVRAAARHELAATAARGSAQMATAAALRGARDVIAAGAAGDALGRVDTHLDTARRRHVAAVDAGALGRAAATALAVHLPLVVTVVRLPGLVRDGTLSAGDAVGAVTYLLSALAVAVTFATGTAWTSVRVVAHLRRLAEPLRPPPAPAHRGGLPASFDLTARRLTFAYRPGAAPIVEGLDLHVPHGDHLAVVGPSGVGKSTLAGLLAGVLAPTGGEVTIGGQPLVGHRLRADLVVTVPQEAYVFAGTLRENLTYLNPAASDADLRAAADAVGLDRVLERLGGLDAEVDTTTEGLSMGERQLIALARAYLAHAPVVILDEATCYLDPAAEARAEEAFIGTGQTLVVIAHRMSAALRARRVVVLDGATVQVGTHDELSATNRLYAELHGYWTEGG